jgi:putative ABC transport system substrate-binding protein
MDGRNGVKRRQVLALGSLAALPAQAQSLPRVGYLLPGTVGSHGAYVPALLRGLGETGLTDGGGFALDVRYAEGRQDRYAALLSELIDRKVAVLVVGSTGAGLAAKRATATIPVVVVSGDDPVAQGLVASVSRPGGNVTAVSLFSAELIGKRLGLLFDLVPAARRAALMVNPNNPNASLAAEAALKAARQSGRECIVVNAASEGEIDTAFATLTERKSDVLLTDSDPFLNSRRERIVALAGTARIVANYPLREYVMAGGLSSYGVDFADSYRQAGTYAGKILRGARPAELPVLQPTKFQLVVNLKPAGALGLMIAPAFLAAADEVIE